MLIWAPKHLSEIGLAIGQHLVLTLTSTLTGLLLALVVGLLSVERPKLLAVTMFIANMIFVVPSLAMFALLVPLVGLGFAPVFLSLSAYAFLIVLRNFEAGLRNASVGVLDAADGMGYDRYQRLVKVEFPLALPMIVSGARLALVTSIGIATVAAFVGGGGLGAIILIGVNQEHLEKILVGSLATGGLAFLCDTAISFLERVALPWR